MANGLHRIQIINRTENDDQHLSWVGTKCFIDGMKIKTVQGVDFHVGVDEVPTFTFKTVGMPDIDMQGQVLFSYAPKTVEDAAKVLQHEFKANPESYRALVSSIESVLKEVSSDIYEISNSSVAKLVANRIIGIE